jgi:hypothetical protein
MSWRIVTHGNRGGASPLATVTPEPGPPSTRGSSTMTPIAAYYIFNANEHERDAAAARGYDVGPRRPSLVERVGAALTALRPARRVASGA